jgi:hypothetical protein
MALVGIKTSTGTGYCDCICGCYELCQLRDDQTNRGYCQRCATEHIGRNRAVLEKIPAPKAPSSNILPLPPGAKPPALQEP